MVDPCLRSGLPVINIISVGTDFHQRAGKTCPVLNVCRHQLLTSEKKHQYTNIYILPTTHQGSAAQFWFKRCKEKQYALWLWKRIVNAVVFQCRIFMVRSWGLEDQTSGFVQKLNGNRRLPGTLADRELDV